MSKAAFAPRGGQAASIHVGVKIKAAWKKNVVLIVSDVDCSAAAAFTKNVVKATTVHVSKKRSAGA